MTDTTLTMRETLERMADMDENAASDHIPKLNELLDRDAPAEQDQFDSAQGEILDTFQTIMVLRKNAEGIRMILKAAD